MLIHRFRRRGTYAQTRTRAHPTKRWAVFFSVWSPRWPEKRKRGQSCIFRHACEIRQSVRRGCTNWCGGKIYNRNQCCHRKQRRRIALVERVVFWGLENSFKGHERRTFQGCIQKIDLWKVVLGSRKVR